MEENKEEWKDVADCFFAHQNYECSNTGFIKNKKNKKYYLQGFPNNWGYIRVILSDKGKRKQYSLARIISTTWIPNPNNLPEIDHIDRNINNNSIRNLRWVDKQQQHLNRSSHPISGVKGSYKTKYGKWQSSIKNPETNKIEYIGTYDTKEEAGQAYDKRALELHQNNIGFLVLNNPIINIST